MKSAYDLAMERLNKQSPTVKLTDKQKKEIAELDSRYAAKLAAQEIALREEFNKAQFAGDTAAAEEAQQRLAHERRSLTAELEEKKEQVRAGKR